ncbi:LysR family transcriptional regulator [Cupriavidus numazuensis]|uniref:HTH-type transcriptional regulator HdfR n=1 Tax=Cupriavidus numazuensis TaxID=221992 RepID=A0ABM8TLR1_9BURK|nr:LysR family transcriptional regulator [Cupriavidus numazuensis]CAG2153428.1 HTH-type transcriptional regulator HdfR [Cupriavidus numazuensis]
MNVSTRQLRAFLGVVKYGNFTKAADRLNITQAGLSAMIRELEGQLQCRLFNRTSRTVELTEAGGHMLPFVERALENLDAGVEGLGYVKSLRKGRLRVGATPYLGSTMMPAAIRRFSSERPDLQLELVDAEQPIVQSLVDSGELDAGFGYLFNLTSGVKIRPLFADPLVLVCPIDLAPDCRFIAKPADWEPLRGATLLVLGRTNPLQKLCNDFLADSEAPAFQRREARHLATLIGMARKGLGIALLPVSVLEPEEHRELRTIELRLQVPVIEHCVLTKAGAELADGLDVFGQIFAQVCVAATRHLLT